MTPWEINPNITYFTNLKLHNFRSFHIPREIPLAPLTFLLGPNSSGKSSIFDALLLLSQSEYNPSLCAVQKPNWIGNLVDLGSFQDTVYNHDLKLPIEISVGISSPVFRKNKKSIYKQPSILLEYKIGDTSDDQLGRFSSFRLTDLTSKDFIKMDYTKNQVITKIPDKKFINNIKEKKSIENREYLFYREQSSEITNQIMEYIEHNPERFIRRKAAWNRIMEGLYYTRNYSMKTVERVVSGRCAPKRWYPSGSSNINKYNNPYYRDPTYSDVDPQMLTNDLDPRYYHGDDNEKVKSLSKMLEDLNIGNSIDPYQLSLYHSAINITDNITGITSNLMDIGYGASQVIPVLRACLSRSRGTLFVEQPEIHLHPKAQSVVSGLLCKTSVNRQVVIETHSVHMVNKARILVAEGKLDPSHVVINLIYRKKAGTYVFPMYLLKNGEFASKWPSGFDFFDERYQETMHLLQLKHLNEK